jgi:predicted transcriptional regulator
MAHTYTNKQICAAFIKNKCRKTEAAAELGMTLNNLIQVIKTKEGLKEMIEEIEESRLDIAEDMLQKLIEQGVPKAVTFFLERKGRKRGYGKKIEIAREEGERKFSSVKIVDGERVIELK